MHVREFEAAGVSGIHIEDQVFGKHTTHSAVLLDRDVMCTRIRACCDARRDKNMMIMFRRHIKPIIPIGFFVPSQN